jgi:hypothetical protein
MDQEKIKRMIADMRNDIEVNRALKTRFCPFCDIYMDAARMLEELEKEVKLE